MQAFVTSRNEYLKQEIDDAKLVVKMGDHPSKYLKSESAPERLLAARLLIQTYRKRNINAVQGNQTHFEIEKRTGIWKIEDGKLWLCVFKEGAPDGFAADRPGTKLMVLKR